MKKLAIEVSDIKESEETRELSRKLVEFNDSQAKTEGHRGLLISVKDSHGSLVGGPLHS